MSVSIAKSILFYSSLREALCQSIRQSEVDDKAGACDFIMREATDFEVLHLITKGEMPEMSQNPLYEEVMLDEIKEYAFEYNDELSESFGDTFTTDLMEEVGILSIIGVGTQAPVLEHVIQYIPEDLDYEEASNEFWTAAFLYEGEAIAKSGRMATQSRGEISGGIKSIGAGISRMVRSSMTFWKDPDVYVSPENRAKAKQKYETAADYIQNKREKLGSMIGDATSKRAKALKMSAIKGKIASDAKAKAAQRAAEISKAKSDAARATLKAARDKLNASAIVALKAKDKAEAEASKAAAEKSALQATLAQTQKEKESLSNAWQVFVKAGREKTVQAAGAARDYAARAGKAISTAAGVVGAKATAAAGAIGAKGTAGAERLGAGVKDLLKGQADKYGATGISNFLSKRSAAGVGVAAAVGATTLTALLLYGAYKTYKKFAARGDKTQGIKAQIRDLQSSMKACGKSTNPGKCKAAITNKINKLKTKLK